MITTSYKDAAEDVVVTFDFSLALATGETLSGTPTVTVATYTGVDVNPAAMLNGAAAISGMTVMQPIQGGVNGNSYAIKCVCATSNAQKILALTALVPVQA